MENIKIRYARPGDIDEILNLCYEHATYEQAIISEKSTKSGLAFHLFNEEILRCLVVEEGKKLKGYATFMKQFSTWDAAYYLYLDCLYLQKSVRGLGLGFKLMQEIKAFAESQGCDIIQWQTPVSNGNAIKFYKNLGACSRAKVRFYWESA